MAKFQVGHVFITPNAVDFLTSLRLSPTGFLNRHSQGDWGDLSEQDRRLNDLSVKNENNPDLRDRIFSAYQVTPSQKVWIITEASRQVTTVLLPEDY